MLPQSAVETAVRLPKSSWRQSSAEFHHCSVLVSSRPPRQCVDPGPRLLHWPEPRELRIKEEIRHVCHQWSLGQTHILASSDHYSQLKIVLSFDILKIGDGRKTCVKIVPAMIIGRPSGSLEEKCSKFRLFNSYHLLLFCSRSNDSWALGRLLWTQPPARNSSGTFPSFPTAAVETWCSSEVPRPFL